MSVRFAARRGKEKGKGDYALVTGECMCESCVRWEPDPGDATKYTNERFARLIANEAGGRVVRFVRRKKRTLTRKQALALVDALWEKA
jgi:hypothetical protein